MAKNYSNLKIETYQLLFHYSLENLKIKNQKSGETLTLFAKDSSLSVS